MVSFCSSLPSISTFVNVSVPLYALLEQSFLHFSGAAIIFYPFSHWYIWSLRPYALIWNSENKVNTCLPPPCFHLPPSPPTFLSPHLSKALLFLLLVLGQFHFIFPFKYSVITSGLLAHCWKHWYTQIFSFFLHHKKQNRNFNYIWKTYYPVLKS